MTDILFYSLAWLASSALGVLFLILWWRRKVAVHRSDLGIFIVSSLVAGPVIAATAFGMWLSQVIAEHWFPNDWDRVIIQQKPRKDSHAHR